MIYSSLIHITFVTLLLLKENSIGAISSELSVYPKWLYTYGVLWLQQVAIYIRS